MSFKKAAISGVFWSSVQQFSGQIIGFFVSIVLARLLLPEEFGLIGIMAIFISLGVSIASSGFNQSIIRMPEPDDIDYSTIFIFNLIVSIVIYIIIFISAPYIANFFNQNILIKLIRWYSIIIPIQALGMMQTSRLTKNMDFKTQLKVGIPSLVFGSIIGITLAFSGYGVWSLVWSGIAQTTLSVILLWFFSRWRPIWVFDIIKFKKHWSFGYKLLISSLLNTIFSNVYAILIGKYFHPAQVGYFQRANSLKQLPVDNISSVLNKVTFPLFSKIQDDNIRLKNIYKRIMKMVIFIVAPTLLLMGVLAEPLFRFLFSERWLPAVPYFQILCINGLFFPIHSYNLNVLTVKGLSGLFLRLEIVKKVQFIIILFISFQFGIYGLLIGGVINSFLALFINSYFSGKYINYTIFHQLKDLTPALVSGIVVSIIVYYVDIYLTHSLHDLSRLVLGSATGIIFYVLIAFIFKFEALRELINIIKSR